MSRVQLMTGNKMYNKSSCKIHASIVEEDTGFERHILAFTKGKEFAGSIPDLQVKSSNWRPAIANKDYKLGGYWGGMEINFTGEKLLMKLMFSSSLGSRRRYGSMLILLRSGSALNSIDFKKVPEMRNKNSPIEETTMNIVEGEFDIITNDVLQSYDIANINANTLGQNNPSSYGYFVDCNEISPMQKNHPVITEESLVMGDGEVVVVKKKESNRRKRIINLN